MSRNQGTLNIFDFRSYREFLHSSALQSSLEKSGKKSLGQIARKLGYRSPRSVGMILKGQRIPSMQMAHALGKQLGLDERQQKYFELLILEESRRKNGKSTEKVQRDLASFHPEKEKKEILSDGAFSYVSEWYHLVIKQLISRPDFKLDLRVIRQRLRKKVSADQIRFALKNLLKLGMIERDSVSGQLKVLKQNVTTPNDIPSEAIRSHHRQMMGQALQALTEQAVTEREFNSATFQINPKRIEEAKRLIREFRSRLEAHMEDPDASEVYQLNIQFFAHTQSNSGKDPR